MRPHTKTTPSLWYCDQPVGKNKVGKVVKEICKIAGIDGNFSNHSLCATSASRMYQSEIPEQVIKEITGHHSECVKVYKRTSDEIREKASSTISSGKLPNEVGKDTSKKDSVCNGQKKETKFSSEQQKHLNESMSVCQMIKNVIKTRMPD